MAGIKGRLATFAIGRDPSGAASADTYDVIAGARELNVSQTNTHDDDTTQEDGGIYSQVANVGDRSITITWNGVFKSSAGVALVRTAKDSDSLYNYEFSEGYTGGITYQGKFTIDTIGKSYSSKGLVMQDITFTSSGAITETVIT